LLVWSNAVLQHYLAFHFHVIGTVIITHLNYVSTVIEVEHMEWILSELVQNAAIYVWQMFHFSLVETFPYTQQYAILFMKMFAGNKTMTLLTA
jgi:hypothetical protein